MMADEHRDEIELSPLLESLAAQYAADPKSKKFLPLAEEYRKSRMYEEALYILQEGLKIHPDYLPARLALAKCYMETKEREFAVNVLGTLLDEYPDNVPGLRLAAELHKDLGNFSRAGEHIKHLLSINPADQVAQSLMEEVKPHLGMEIKVLTEEVDNRKYDGTWQHHETAVSLELDTEMPTQEPERSGLDLDEAEAGEEALSLTVPTAAEERELTPHVIELSSFEVESPEITIEAGSRIEESEEKPIVSAEQTFTLEESATPVFEIDEGETGLDEAGEELTGAVPADDSFRMEGGEEMFEDEEVVEVDIDAPLFAVEEGEVTGDDSFDMFHKLSESRGPISLDLPGQESGIDAEREQEDDDSEAGLSTIRRVYAAVEQEEKKEREAHEEPPDVTMDEAIGTGLPEAETLTTAETESYTGDEEELLTAADAVIGEEALESGQFAVEAVPTETAGEDILASEDRVSEGSEDELLLGAEDILIEESLSVESPFEVLELHTVEGSDLLNIEEEELELGKDAIVTAASELPVDEEVSFETVSFDELPPAEEMPPAEVTEEPENVDERDFLLGGEVAEEVSDAGVFSSEFEAERPSAFTAEPLEEPVSFEMEHREEHFIVETSQPEPGIDGAEAAPITATSARIYEEQGLHREALEIYRKLAARFPEMPEYLEKIAEIEGKLIAAEGPATDWDQERAVEILRRWLRNIDTFKATMEGKRP